MMQEMDTLASLIIWFGFIQLGFLLRVIWKQLFDPSITLSTISPDKTGFTIITGYSE